MTRKGIDIASFQHPNGASIDYKAATDQLRAESGGLTPFVVVKITEGVSYVNPYWQADVHGFAAQGCATAGYPFDHGRLDPVAEADFFRHVAGPGLAMLLDGEAPEGLTAAQYRDHMAAAIGREPIRMEYLNQSQLSSGELAAGAWLWLAEYDGGGYKGEKMRQTTSNKTVNGIQAPCDGDEWLGTDEEFVALFNSGPLPTPVPPVPVPAPPIHAPDGNPWTVLRMDGVFGTFTTKATQWKDGDPDDGVWGPISRKGMQRRLGVAADGIIGKITISALQRRVRCGVDGIWGKDTTDHLQAAMNLAQY